MSHSSKNPNTVTLNPELKRLNSEVVIDVFTAGLGGYCGSFVCPAEDAERIAFALNSHGKLMIRGVQTNHENIYCKIRPATCTECQFEQPRYSHEKYGHSKDCSQSKA